MARRKTKKVGKHKGGKFINAGSAGCVFGDPPLKCKKEDGRRSSRYISKLTNLSVVQDSLDVFKALKQLDPGNEFFISPEVYCEFDRADVKPEDEIDKCEEHEDYEALLIMEKGGKDLSNMSLANSEYIPFLNSIPNLLRAIDVLHSNNLAHFDIKPTNILTVKNRDNTFKTRLIDFDLISRNNQVEDHLKHLLKNMYVYWPLELKFYYKNLYGGTYTDYEIEKLISSWYKDQKDYAPYLIPGNAYFNKNLKEKYNKDDPEIRNLKSLDYSSYNLSKVDIFSLGKTLSDIYYNLMGHYLSIDDDNNEVWRAKKICKPVLQECYDWNTLVILHISHPLILMIKEMIDINPDNRPTIKEIIIRYDELLPHINSFLTEENLNKYLIPNLTQPRNYAYESPLPSPISNNNSPFNRPTNTRRNRSRSRNRNQTNNLLTS